MIVRNIKPILSSSSQCYLDHLPVKPAILINAIQVRTSFYNKHKHGPLKISNPKPDYIQWLKDFFGREGWEFLKSEPKRIFQQKITSKCLEKEVKSNETYPFEHFDGDDWLKRWKPVADSDSLNGFSISTLSRSKAGHCLFKGVLDTRLPDDGLTQQSGFAAMVGPAAPRTGPLNIDTHWNWSQYNCVEIRFRGDGRKYDLVLNTSSYLDDLSYYDTMGHPLYTRGGPYWQTFRIPFSKFIFSNKGFIQDKQGYLPTHTIKFVSIALQDTVDGPFELEIDYIGLRNETSPFTELTKFEMYTFPHIKYIQVMPGCDPPETE